MLDARAGGGATASAIGVDRGARVTVWAAIASTLCMLIGWQWDISWHRSIGRDTLWTPAHVAIYIALAIAFAYNAWLVLSYSFGANKERDAIRVLGFAAPTAVFVTLWGILFQFTGIVFDAWWHDTYGIDSAMVTPPHNLIGIGIWVFYLGQFMYVTLRRNQGGEGSRLLWIGSLFVWSFFIGNLFIGNDPTFGPAAVRSGLFVLSCALFVPFALSLIQTYLGWRWAGVTVSAMYMLNAIVLIQVFQLFPSTPRFGPVYHRIDYFLPPAFPVLLVVPAFFMSLVLAAKKRPTFRTHVVVGAVFVVVFTVANWLFSGFLMSSLAENRFFIGNVPGTVFLPGFRPLREIGLDGVTAAQMAGSMVFATASSWLGVGLGRWLKGVTR